jgi:hypothetical protein
MDSSFGLPISSRRDLVPIPRRVVIPFPSLIAIVNIVEHGDADATVSSWSSVVVALDCKST